MWRFARSAIICKILSIVKNWVSSLHLKSVLYILTTQLIDLGKLLTDTSWIFLCTRKSGFRKKSTIPYMIMSYTSKYKIDTNLSLMWQSSIDVSWGVQVHSHPNLLYQTPPCPQTLKILRCLFFCWALLVLYLLIQCPKQN